MNFLRCAKRVFGGLLAAAWLTSGTAHAAQVEIPGPPGSVAFGRHGHAVPNGNLVVTDPAGPVAGVGAVYLFRPDGTLVSTLTGGSAQDHVGGGGIVVLASGHFVVRSTDWSNGLGA